MPVDMCERKEIQAMARREDNNFKKAVNGLLGYGEKEAAEEEKPVSYEEKPQEDFSVKETPQEAPAEPPVKREEAVIPSDMVITGNVVTGSNMKIMGSIVGDVECEGSVCLLGSIQGNVSAGNLTLQRGNLTGDVTVRENVVIEQEAVLKGNLSAQNVRSNAKSEGEIQASGMVDLQAKAFVEGDITAGMLSVTAGAKIKGMVNVSE